MKRFSQPQQLQLPQQSKYVFVQKQDTQNVDIKASLQGLSDRLERMDENNTSLLSRILNEVIELRKENSILKAKVLQIENKEYILPTKPFENIQDFKNFEKEIQIVSEKHSLLVSEFRNINCNSSDKFVRICWRKIFVDEVAEHYSWRGTASKESIRGLSLTLAIRSAYRQKFSLGDEDFDKTSQKFFQYARDRMIKLQKYESKKGEVDQSS